MPPPLAALADLLRRPSSEQLHEGLYAILRAEQAVVASHAERTEVSRALDLAQAAYGDLVGVVVGREDALLDGARDGEWSLRDLLRHVIAAELRYAAQIDYSATRADGDPVPIPPDRLPCDRLSPPDPAFAGSRDGGIVEVLELVGVARRSTDTRLATLGDETLARPTRWGAHDTDVRTRLHQIGVHLTEAAIQAAKMLADSPGDLRGIVRRLCFIRGLHERWSDSVARGELDRRYAKL